MLRNKTYPVLIGLSYWMPLANSATPINAEKKKRSENLKTNQIPKTKNSNISNIYKLIHKSNVPFFSATLSKILSSSFNIFSLAVSFLAVKINIPFKYHIF